MNDLRFRAHAAVDAAGALRPAMMQIKFVPIGGQPFFVDDVLLERTTPGEVGAWADGFYDSLPAHLSYGPAATRWKRLPLTMERLRGHQKLRVVVLGDGIQQDLANSPIDVFLERQYPGCRVEVVPSIVSGAGVQFFKDHVAEYCTNLKPDLLIIGGVSNDDEMSSFQQLVDQVRANDLLAHRRTEMLLLTNGWSSNAVRDNLFRFTSDMTELDQELKNNAGVPDDYRGHLLKFAAVNEIEFLDMMGIASEFIFGPAALANVGPPTNADGVPYSFWMRDWIHPDESGKQIMGRILESYFSPDAGRNKATKRDRRETLGVPSRMFDPERSPGDREMLAVARREFQVSILEKPALAKTFARGSRMTTGSASSNVAFRLEGGGRREIGYNFDEPLDVLHGDVAVYWAFRADRSEGEEKSKLAMHLAFTEPGAVGRHERAQVSQIVRPGGASILGVGGELESEHSVENQVEVPVDSFVDPMKASKFRVVLRWTGGDRVVAEAACWDARTSRWVGFTPYERPGAPPLVMELSVAAHLGGKTAFKSLFFEAASDNPSLETVLVTMRPSMVR